MISNLLGFLGIFFLLYNYLNNRRFFFLFFFAYLLIIPVINRFAIGIQGTYPSKNILMLSLIVNDFLLLLYVVQFKVKVKKEVTAYIIIIFISAIFGLLNSSFIKVLLALRVTLIPIMVYLGMGTVNKDLHYKIYRSISIFLTLICLYESVTIIVGFPFWEIAFLRFGDNPNIALDNEIFRNPSGYNLTYPVSMFMAYLIIKLAHRKKLFRYEWIFIVNGLFLILVALERTPIISIVISVAFFLLFVHTKFKFSLRTFAILLLMFFLVFTFFTFDFDSGIKSKRASRFIELQSGSDVSTWQSRINTHWAAGNKFIFSVRSLIGYGLMFNAEYRDKPLHRGMHSMYYNQIIEMGWFSMLILLLLLKESLKTKRDVSITILVFFLLGIPNSPFLTTARYFFWYFLFYSINDRGVLIEKGIDNNIRISSK